MTWLVRLLPYLLGAGGIAAGAWVIWDNGYETAMAEVDEIRADAVDRAITQERQLQEDADEITKGQMADLAGVNDRLSADIERLRNRPPRTIRVPTASGAECTGATGAELSGPDAEFLARLAAEADRLRAGLRACYQYADAISGGSNTSDE